jgi:bacteriocin biosynthesis cyclodehydratase domain-containing protein
MKIQFRPDITPISCTQSGLVLFITEDNVRISRSPQSARLAAFIADGDDPEAEYEGLLATWRSQGLLIPNQPLVQRDAAFWASAGLPLGLTEAPPLAVLPLAALGTNLLETALVEAGFKLDDRGLIVVAVDDYLSEDLHELHRSFRKWERPWLPVKLVGHTTWMGPVFSHQAESPCWACLAHHIRRNRWPQCLLWGHHDNRYPPQFSVAATSTTLAMGVGAIAHLLGSWARESHRFPLTDRLYTFDTRTLKLRAHTVVRRPNCPDCGSSRPLSVPRTLEGLRRFVSPIVGLVPDVEIHTQEYGLFHARAELMQPLPVGNARPLMKPNTAIGKGLTPDAAEMGCLAEAVERYSIVFQGDEPLRRAPIASQDGLDYVNLNDLMQISPRQYSERVLWMGNDDPRCWIPHAYEADQEIDWIGVSVLNPGLLGNEVVRFVPAAYCYLGFPEKDNCRPDTNGCAAGQTLDDAILRGLLELIERDAAAIWWYNRVRRPAIRPDTLGAAPEALMIFSEFERMGRRVHLLDLTTDIGIPVYAAITTTQDGRELFFGLGCSPDPKKAAFQALAEMGQVSFWIGRNWQDDSLWSDWMRNASLTTEPHLDPLGEVALPLIPAGAENGKELEYCLFRLHSMGLEVLALALTRVEVGLPVARVIVPGLRHFWRRFAPGRLYDVPVKLGWLPKPVCEEDLNPLPCLL